MEPYLRPSRFLIKFDMSTITIAGCAQFVTRPKNALVRLLEMLGHGVEGFDVSLFRLHGLFPGKSHDKHDKAVFGHLNDARRNRSTTTWVGAGFDRRLKVEPTEFLTAFQPVMRPEHTLVGLFEMLCHAPDWQSRPGHCRQGPATDQPGGFCFLALKAGQPAL